jgi:hypothetical protein
MCIFYVLTTGNKTTALSFWFIISFFGLVGVSILFLVGWDKNKSKVPKQHENVKDAAVNTFHLVNPVIFSMIIKSF